MQVFRGPVRLRQPACFSGSPFGDDVSARGIMQDASDLQDLLALFYTTLLLRIAGSLALNRVNHWA